MKLPDLQNFDLKGKKILLRVNYDVPIQEGKVTDDSRIVESLPTINYLLEQKAKVILLSHLGRPDGKVVPEYSLRPCAKRLQELLPEINIKLNTEYLIQNIEENQIVMLENLRFDPGEENNDPEFAKKLAGLGDFYINDAFAVSHRAHASVVGLPLQFKSKSMNTGAAGFDLLEEVKNLSGLMENPRKPVVFVFGGVKKDKLENLPGILKWIDKVLIGGKFPELLDNSLKDNPKLIIGTLTADGTDIDSNTIEIFKKEINQAGTVIFAGPMGKYEEREDGTKEIIQAIVESSAYKVAGGGDTESAISKFGFDGKFDFISSGGGAMLEFLSQEDLPGLKALRE